MDVLALFEEVFGIIEPALEQAGYHVLEGDSNTACVIAPDGENSGGTVLLRAQIAADPGGNTQQRGGSPQNVPDLLLTVSFPPCPDRRKLLPPIFRVYQQNSPSFRKIK